jgi:hypothetical protein
MGNQNGTSQQPQAAQMAKAPRMTLSSISRGKTDRPYRIVLYAGSGVGKSTFGASAPNPIFIAAEDGTFHLEVSRFPTPESWTDILDAIDVLTREKNDFKTVVLDSADWAETLLWKHVCEVGKVTSIEDVGGGYGRGYSAAIDQWRILLSVLERLQSKTGMHVIILAHSVVKPFRSPISDDWDRWEMKLNAKAAGLLGEWADELLYAAFETFATKDAKTKRVKGVSSGARLIYSTRNAAWDAKTRRGLPETLALDWAEFEAAAKGSELDAGVLVEEVKQKAKVLGGEMEKATLASLGRVGQDVSKLKLLSNWCETKLAAKGNEDADSRRNVQGEGTARRCTWDDREEHGVRRGRVRVRRLRRQQPPDQLVRVLQ